VGHRSRDRRNCRRKLRHPHYLSALLHARRLRQDDNLGIYPCPICRRLHVGHSRKIKRKRPAMVYATPQERKKARLKRRIAQVQQQLAQLQQNLQQLLAAEQTPPAQEDANRPDGSQKNRWTKRVPSDTVLSR
jgi:hypothetical protein